MYRSLCVCVRLGVTFTFIFIINFYNNNPTITRAMLDLGWTQKQMTWMVKRIRKAFVRNLKDRGKMQPVSTPRKREGILAEHISSY